MKVFLRPSSDGTASGRESVETASLQKTSSTATRASVLDLLHATERERRAHQVKELIRLCGLLRADLSMDEVLQQIVSSMTVCTGFRALAVNLLDQSGKYFFVSAAVGISPAEELIIRSKSMPYEIIYNIMQHSELAISQSYFIPHSRAHEMLSGTAFVTPMQQDNEALQPNQWHPEDFLIVPLYNPREQKLLGYLSLDDPEDGKLPTEEAIEVVELFANKVALAIDNARIFEEREIERLALEDSIAALRRDLAIMAQGDLRSNIQATHTKLNPVADSINSTIETISAILSDMQKVSGAVDNHMQSVHQNTEALSQDAWQQQEQITTIANTINDFALMMHNISERAAYMSRTAVEAVEVTNDVQGKVDRVIEGMGDVRNATLQSERLMKLLGESGQQLSETGAPLNDLTTRMHLLALNAAIEATRAGENGQSFTVIAQEMRSLAMISTEVTRQINEYIRTIQNETTQVARSVEQSTQTVVAQSESVMLTGVSLDAMSEVTDQLKNLIQEICAIAESQSQSSTVVMASVNEVRRMTGEVTSHIEEMRRSVNGLVESSNSLRSKIARIQLRP